MEEETRLTALELFQRQVPPSPRVEIISPAFHAARPHFCPHSGQARRGGSATRPSPLSCTLYAWNRPGGDSRPKKSSWESLIRKPCASCGYVLHYSIAKRFYIFRTARDLELGEGGVLGGDEWKNTTLQEEKKKTIATQFGAGEN